MRRALWTIVLLAPLVAACAGSQGDDERTGHERGGPAGPVGNWVVTALDGRAAPQGLTMEIAADRLNGSSGCNIYNTSWTAEGDRLTLGPIAGTRRACPEPEAANEHRFLTALGKVTRYRRAGDALELLDDDDTVLLRLGPAKE